MANVEASWIETPCKVSLPRYSLAMFSEGPGPPAVTLEVVFGSGAGVESSAVDDLTRLDRARCCRSSIPN